MATTELVASLAGPAKDVGSLATTRRALSQVKMKTLLYPPSFFSYPAIEAAPGHSSMTLLRNALELKLEIPSIALELIMTKPSPTCVCVKVEMPVLPSLVAIGTR